LSYYERLKEERKARQDVVTSNILQRNPDPTAEKQGCASVGGELSRLERVVWKLCE
jgi:hypothetical protein